MGAVGAGPTVRGGTRRRCAGDQLDSAERQVFFEAGSAACDAGATLGALIDSYLRGAGQLWEQLFAETHEAPEPSS